jgi:hypothetical protein
MSAYADYQSARDREYAAAWEKLTPAQRRQMEKAGVSGPDVPRYSTHKRDEEAIVERAAAQVEPVADQEDNQSDPIVSEDLLAALRRVVGEMLATDNVRLTLECLSLVTGISYSGESMTSIARRLGLTRAAVSKRCVEITETIGLPPSRAMRRLTARTVYARRAQNCHSRGEH